MAITTLRPRFRYVTHESKVELYEKLRKVLNDPNSKFGGHAFDYQATIDFKPEERRYWTPQIDFSIDEHPEGAIIRGLVGPRPAIWTSFMFIYTLLALLAIGGLVIGMGQWTMGHSPVAFWLIPVSGIVFLTFFFIAKAGKKIAHDQSVEIHEYLLSLLNNPKYISLDEL